MPTGWRIEAVRLTVPLTVQEEPFGAYQDEEGEVFILTMKPVEIEGPKTSVVEGSLEPAKDKARHK
jgi:hypothetical protein